MTVPARMPDAVRRTLLGFAVALAATAAVGNFWHVHDFAHRPDLGGQGTVQAAVAALLPDVLIVLAVVKLRWVPRSVWAWTGLAASVAVVAWAAVATANPTVTARAVAVWPLMVAVIAAGLIETRPKPDRPVPARRPVKIAAPRNDNPPPATPAAAKVPPTVQGSSKPPANPGRTTVDLDATAPVPGESDSDRTRRLGAARVECVREVASRRAMGDRVTISDIKRCYSAADTWAKAVSADANKLNAPAKEDAP